MGLFRKVAETKDLEPGTARLVEIEGKEIALFNVDGEFHAIDNTCTHVGGPLAEGTIESDVVTCPWHGATYSIKTGEVLSSARGLSVEGALISSIYSGPQKLDGRLS